MKQWVEGCGMMEVKPAKDDRPACEWCGKKYTLAQLERMTNNWYRTGREPRCTKCREYMTEPFETLGGVR